MFAGSRASGEPQYGSHVACAKGTSHRQARLSQRLRSESVTATPASQYRSIVVVELLERFDAATTPMIPTTTIPPITIHIQGTFAGVVPVAVVVVVLRSVDDDVSLEPFEVLGPVMLLPVEPVPPEVVCASAKPGARTRKSAIRARLSLKIERMGFPPLTG
jgi:hypothetical protein